MKSSFDEIDCNKPSLNKLSSNEKKEEVKKNNGKENITYESLVDDEKKVQLEIKKRIFELI